MIASHHKPKPSTRSGYLIRIECLAQTGQETDRPKSRAPTNQMGTGLSNAVAKARAKVRSDNRPNQRGPRVDIAKASEERGGYFQPTTVLLETRYSWPGPSILRSLPT